MHHAMPKCGTRTVARFALLLTPLILTLLSLARVHGDILSQESKTAARVVFDDHFLPRTMRLDYFHCGTATEQHVALAAIVADGTWAGSRHQLVDELDLGEYSYEVRDASSGQLLYSRGFCSVFGEWQTIPEAKQRWGTFHESLRFPWPKKPIKVVLRQRIEGQWHEIWNTTVEPDSRFVTDAATPRRDRTWEVFTHGDPCEKVDIVFLGDGFTNEDMPEFHSAVKRLAEAIFSVEPFKSRRSDFNVRAIDVVAAQSGVSRPRSDIFRRSPLSCSYNAFDLPRYALTFDNKTVRDVAAQVPYDCLVILLNEETYGGGGIYHDQTIAAAHNAMSNYVVIHEFGHHFAGLGDEYYSSNVAYETGKPIEREPWEPNVTALLDGSPKWKGLVTPGIPIPTPWNKKAFESHGKTNSKPAGNGPKTPSKSLAELLAENEHAGKVGAFEGARYESEGLYRPAVNCAMFSRSTHEFCPVCQHAIARAIDRHVARRDENDF